MLGCFILKNTDLTYGLIELEYVDDDVSVIFENLVISNSTVDDGGIITFNDHSYTDRTGIDLYIGNVELIDSYIPYNILIKRAQYVDIENVSYYSTQGMGCENSYVSSIIALDWARQGEINVDSIYIKDTVLKDTIISLFGWTVANITDIMCDNCYSVNNWVYFEFYNTGDQWQNTVSNIYLNGYYSANNLTLNDARNKYNCEKNYGNFVQSVFYLYYDGEEVSWWRRRSRRRSNRRRRGLISKHTDEKFENDNLLEHMHQLDPEFANQLIENLDNDDEFREWLGKIQDVPSMTNTGQRKLMTNSTYYYYYYYYYDCGGSYYASNCDVYNASCD